MNLFKKRNLAIIIISIFSSYVFAAQEIHLKLSIYHDQSLLANATLIVEENKTSSMNMSMPGFQEYELDILLKKTAEKKLHTKLGFQIWGT